MDATITKEVAEGFLVFCLAPIVWVATMIWRERVIYRRRRK